jgi:hypothetical protein
MEKRDICLDFLREKCDKKENCKYGHVIMDNKEDYIKFYEDTTVIDAKIKETILKLSKDEPLIGLEDYKGSFNTMPEKNGRIPIMSKCFKCQKGFRFYRDEVQCLGEPRSITCDKCLEECAHLLSYN